MQGREFVKYLTSDEWEKYISWSKEELWHEKNSECFSFRHRNSKILTSIEYVKEKETTKN